MEAFHLCPPQAFSTPPSLSPPHHARTRSWCLQASNRIHSTPSCTTTTTCPLGPHDNILLTVLLLASLDAVCKSRCSKSKPHVLFPRFSALTIHLYYCLSRNRVNSPLFDTLLSVVSPSFSPVDRRHPVRRNSLRSHLHCDSAITTPFISFWHLN